MHGLFFILFIPILIISIIINIIYINFRKKALITLWKNIIFNLILFILCILVSVIIFIIIQSFHDEIGCAEIGTFEPGITITIILIPIADFFYIKKHKNAHNTMQSP
jgi:hypothetical protein